MGFSVSNKPSVVINVNEAINNKAFSLSNQPIAKVSESSGIINVNKSLLKNSYAYSIVMFISCYKCILVFLMNFRAKKTKRGSC